MEMIKMLPDFPSFKTKIESSTINFISNRTCGSPLLSKINKKTCFEGRGFSFVDGCGDYVEKTFEKTGSEFSVSLDEVLEKGLVASIEKFLEANKEIQQKMTRMLLNEVNIATTKAGTNFKTDKKLITEIYLEGLKNVQVDFDERGNPYLPSMPMHPDDDLKYGKILDEHLKKNPNHMEEYQMKLDEIMEIKRKEWHDRESNRKLVD